MQDIFIKINLVAQRALLWQVHGMHSTLSYTSCINKNVTYGARVAICGAGGADEGAVQCIIELDALCAHVHVSLTVQYTEAIALGAARIERYCEIPHIHVTCKNIAMHTHKQQRKRFTA